MSIAKRSGGKMTIDEFIKKLEEIKKNENLNGHCRVVLDSHNGTVSDIQELKVIRTGKKQICRKVSRGGEPTLLIRSY